MEQQAHAQIGSALLSVTEVSHRLNVSERLVRDEIARGRLVSIQLRRRRLVTEEDLRAYIAAHRDGGEAA